MTVAAADAAARHRDPVVVALFGAGVALAVAVLAAPPGGTGVAVGAGLAFWLAVATLIAISDAREHRIPNRLVVQLTVVSFLVLGLVEFLDTESSTSIRAIVGASVASLVALLIHAVTAGGLGMGDVKLMFPVVLTSGLFGGAAVWTALVVAVLLASVLIAVRLVLRLGDGAVPLAPFLIAGSGVALLAA